MRLNQETLKKRRHEDGQSVVEFLLTSFAFFTVFFMIVKLALGFALGHYIHYVTFMAARALHSGGYDESTQKANAQATLHSYLGDDGNRFQSIAKSSDEVLIGHGSLYNTSPATTWVQEGVSYKFKIKFYMVPLLGAIAQRASQGLELTSESWLGRETSYSECVSFLESGNGSGGGGSSRRPWYFDNGC